METKSDDTEVLETPVKVDEGTTDETAQTPEVTAEEIAELRRKAQERDELEDKNKKLFARLEKQKETTKALKEQSDLSTKDVLFLAKENLHEDDQEMLLKYAKANNLDLQAARKELRPVFDVRAQERRTAEATHVKGGARGSSKVSAEELLMQAQKEEIEPTDENMNEIFKARLAKKLPKKR